MRFDKSFGIGSRSGKLTIMEIAYRKSTPWGSRIYYKCKCDCGKKCIVLRNSLKSGHIQSCGCLHWVGKPTHGATVGGKREPLYGVWNSMKQRCYSKTCVGYKYWGGRGIGVHKEWMNDYSVFRTWALSNGYGKRMTLDRIDNDGNYSPDNCRWVTHHVQNRNSRHCRLISVNGERKPLTAWVEDPRCKIKINTFYQRINNGWDEKEALFSGPTPRALRRLVVSKR